MSQVLVLRPQPGAGATAEKAAKLGLRARAVPLFEIVPTPWTAPDPGSFDGLLLTSANAVRCAGEDLRHYRGMKSYAVGEATAAAARHAGFDLAATGNAGIERLLASIEPHLRLIHLCGEHRRDCPRARQEIVRVPVYGSREIERPDLRIAAAEIALLHSARAGSRFAELVRERKSIVVAAISEVTAQAAGLGWKEVAVAQEPTDDALLALAARLCNNAETQ